MPFDVAVDPGAVVGDREHDVAVPPRERDRDVVAAVLERVLEELGEDERERGGTLAGERDRLEVGRHVLPRHQPLHEHRAQAVDELAEVDVVLAMLGQHLVHGRDGEDPVDRVVRATSAGRRSSARACRRRSDATVWRLFLTRWWISWASTPRITARPCSSATAAWWAIASSSASSSARERRVPIADELADLAPLPAQRHAYGVRAGAALGPRDLPVLENERRAGRVQRLHRRLHDRLERLLEVERLRDGLRDARERLELRDPPLRALVQLRVLDRLGDLRRDRDEQLDLGVGERPRLAACGRSARPRACPARGSARRGSTRTRPPAGSGTP